MFERVIAQVDPSGLTDACGLEPSFVCEWIWDVSDNERLAEISAWAVEKPLKTLRKPDKNPYKNLIITIQSAVLGKARSAKPRGARILAERDGGGG